MEHKDRLRVGWSKEYADKFENIRYYPTFFKEYELKCPCCGENETSDRMYMMLDKLRGEYGKPLFVDSGYRCPKHNKKIKGAPNSAHMTGEAADIRVTGAIRRRKLVDIAVKLGFNGIGIYDKHIHVDIGEREHGKKVMWSGKSK